MATKQVTTPQSLAEIRTWFVSFANDLPTGVTVASVVAIHVPPQGNASTPVVVFTVSPTAEITLGPLSFTGLHLLHIIATLSDGEKSEILLEIPVNY